MYDQGLCKVLFNDWRLRQLRNYKVSCDAAWIWSLVPLRRTFTGHVWQVGVLSPRVNTQPVSEARFSLSLVLTHFPFPLYTLVWLNYPWSFQTVFHTQSNFSFDFFFFFSLSPTPIWFLFFSPGVWQPKIFYLLSVLYHTYVVFFVLFVFTRYALCLLAKLKPYFALWHSLSMYNMKCAPFDWNLLWLTVFYFSTFASHGNCNLVCYSPAFWTCGLECLAGRQAALSGSVFMQVQDIEDTPPCRVFWRGFSEQPTLQY